jgi:hypothetical protein
VTSANAPLAGQDARNKPVILVRKKRKYFSGKTRRRGQITGAMTDFSTQKSSAVAANERHAVT